MQPHTCSILLTFCTMSLTSARSPRNSPPFISVSASSASMMSGSGPVDAGPCMPKVVLELEELSDEVDDVPRTTAAAHREGDKKGWSTGWRGEVQMDRRLIR